MAAVTSSSLVHQGVLSVGEYHQFCADFLALVKAGKTAEADKLLNMNKNIYAGLIHQCQPFDAQIETLVQDGTVDTPFLCILEMAKILRKYEADTSCTRVYELGGLISLGKIDDANEFLAANPAIQDVAQLLLSVYETLEEIDGPRRTLMEKVIAFRPKDETVLDLREALKMGQEDAKTKV